MSITAEKLLNNIGFTTKGFDAGLFGPEITAFVKELASHMENFASEQKLDDEAAEERLIALILLLWGGVSPESAEKEKIQAMQIAKDQAKAMVGRKSSDLQALWQGILTPQGKREWSARLNNTQVSSSAPYDPRVEQLDKKFTQAVALFAQIFQAQAKSKQKETETDEDKAAKSDKDKSCTSGLSSWLPTKWGIVTGLVVSGIMLILAFVVLPLSTKGSGSGKKPHTIPSGVSIFLATAFGLADCAVVSALEKWKEKKRKPGTSSRLCLCCDPEKAEQPDETAALINSLKNLDSGNVQSGASSSTTAPQQPSIWTSIKRRISGADAADKKAAPFLPSVQPDAFAGQLVLYRSPRSTYGAFANQAHIMPGNLAAQNIIEIPPPPKVVVQQPLSTASSSQQGASSSHQIPTTVREAGLGISPANAPRFFVNPGVGLPPPPSSLYTSCPDFNNVSFSTH